VTVEFCDPVSVGDAKPDGLTEPEPGRLAKLDREPDPHALASFATGCLMLPASVWASHMTSVP
ncbi:MAG: hypothetical protein QOC87_2093, partial [Actinomycetota bacterium]|nr:hypothetical protein [Actinomycetota bacterium]